MKISSFLRKVAFASLLLVTAFACKHDKNPLSSSGSNGQNVGNSAHDLLSNATYQKIQIEIHYMPGAKPEDNTVNALKDFVSAQVNKSEGISISISEIPSAGKSVYSLSDINSLEKTYRTQFNSGNTVAVHFLFVDGGYTKTNVLGIAYKNTSLCIFEKVIQDNSGNLLQPSTTKLETTVMNHEFGHILGLVDVGSPMQSSHRDAANGAHCNNTACLMYYQVETTDYVNNLLNSSVPVLDANCKADLVANGGK